jgi:hypothetical protein
MKIYIAFFMCVVFSVSASDEEKQQENERLRKEARNVVQQAYEKARSFCLRYPDSDHTVNIKTDDDELTVTVKCEVVNAFFLGKSRNVD